MNPGSHSSIYIHRQHVSKITELVQGTAYQKSLGDEHQNPCDRKGNWHKTERWGGVLLTTNRYGAIDTVSVPPHSNKIQKHYCSCYRWTCACTQNSVLLNGHNKEFKLCNDDTAAAAAANYHFQFWFNQPIFPEITPQWARSNKESSEIAGVILYRLDALPVAKQQ